MALRYMRYPMLFCCIFLSGCLLINTAYKVNNLNKKTFILPDRSYILIGLSRGDQKGYTGLTFVEYDSEKEEVAGDCMVFNKINPHFKKDEHPSKDIQYFLYNVPSGYWAYYDNNIRKLNTPSGARSILFKVPQNKVVYIGNYIATKNGWNIEFNTAEAQKEVKRRGLSPDNVLTGKPVDITSPPFLLCMF